MLLLVAVAGCASPARPATTSADAPSSAARPTATTEKRSPPAATTTERHSPPVPTTPTTAAAPPAATAAAPPRSPPGAPPAEPPPATTPSGNSWARIEVSNPCDAKTDYCVEQGASTSHTWLGGRSTTTHNLNPGDKVRAKKSGSCGDVLYTVAKAGELGKVDVCKK